MDNENKKDRIAMLISERESVIIRSIQMKLESMRIDSVLTRSRIDDIDEHKRDVDFFVVYLPNEMSEDFMKALVYLAEFAEEQDKSLILIGETHMKGILMSRFRWLGSLVLWFDRPLDIDEFGIQVNRALKQHARQNTMKRILVVDDDPNYAKMVREWLMDVYKVDLVASGAQALNFLSKNKVDLILLDYEMPVVDGPQVLQMLREETSTAYIPVIFLTGVGKKESVAKVLSLKPQGYILKSTSKSDLLMTLRDFFIK
ncbi:PleD family two-component system response regulator [Butyrivibrio sp. JL13D10]|uniref:response regulator n=1 Tax=Butyrivibrio sp. JL13D10 TaxID=3236815 RepID=UPI0038B535E5